MAWYGYESVCAGASLGETISNWDSSKLGRSSYDDSPEVRGTASAPAVLRGGDATSRDGARDDVNDSVEETLGRCGFVRAAMLALTFDTCDARLAEREPGGGGLRGVSGSVADEERGMSTSVMVDETPDARFMTDESSTTFDLRCSLSERKVETDEDGAWPLVLG